MILLVTFAFLAGIVTILSPCILPILPIILSSSLSGGKKRAVGVVSGFIFSFTFFTLFLTTIVKTIGISADYLRNFSVVVIFLFGVSLLIPKFQNVLERLFARLSAFAPKRQATGFWSGAVIGVSIGLLWTPCVGPILGSVISLALTGAVTGSAFLITLSYSLGTAIPMLAIIFGGQNILRKPWLLANGANIQKAFGVVMMITAMGIFFNFDRKVQSFILDKFPNYGVGLTRLEDNEFVKDQLDRLRGDGPPAPETTVGQGKPMFDFQDTATIAPEIIPGGSWFNLSAGSRSLTLKELRGKVVLVDFWTYTCINCIRTLPYLRDWHEKYADKGLVIIGVHTPEFEFEKNPQNVEKAIKDYGLNYPIVQDNDYATWRAYANRYWPAKYLVSANGKIVYTHFGEGDYDETEEKIQELLKEAGEEVNEKVDNPKYDIATRTPELYLGYGRMGFFASPEKVSADKRATYSFPDDLPIHHFAYKNSWTIKEEYSASEADGSLILGFEAKEVFLVMRPTNKDVSIEILVDGKKDNFGDDVKNGIVEVDSDRLYKLVKFDRAGQHTLQLTFPEGMVEIFAFTFG